ADRRRRVRVQEGAALRVVVAEQHGRTREGGAEVVDDRAGDDPVGGVGDVLRDRRPGGDRERAEAVDDGVAGQEALRDEVVGADRYVQLEAAGAVRRG